MLESIISFFLANLLVSWIASIIFTGSNKEDKNLGLLDEHKLFRYISNKKWKTFLYFFIGYCIIFLIIYLCNK